MPLRFLCRGIDCEVPTKKYQFPEQVELSTEHDQVICISPNLYRLHDIVDRILRLVSQIQFMEDRRLDHYYTTSMNETNQNIFLDHLRELPKIEFFKDKNTNSIFSPIDSIQSLKKYISKYYIIKQVEDIQYVTTQNEKTGKIIMYLGPPLDFVNKNLASEVNNFYKQILKDVETLVEFPFKYAIYKKQEGASVTPNIYIKKEEFEINQKEQKSGFGHSSSSSAFKKTNMKQKYVQSHGKTRNAVVYKCKRSYYVKDATKKTGYAKIKL